jgi:hypothetical protein
MRPAPKRPPDPYVKIRWLLHITAVVAIISPTFGLPVTVFLGVAAVCEFTAIFLLSRKPEEEATDATDVGLRLGCGTIFGLIAVPWTAYWWGWKYSDAGLVVLAIAGGVVCAALALRFGERFWDFVLRNRRSPF